MYVIDFIGLAVFPNLTGHGLLPPLTYIVSIQG